MKKTKEPTWSVRALQRNISSQYYYRLLKSQTKQPVIDEMNKLTESKNYDKWKSSSYTPNAGDIIFFDWYQNGNPDHVGIVEKVEKGKIYTIEGNSSDEVKAKSYSLDYKSIFGYGITK